MLFRSALSALKRLLFPAICPVCGKSLIEAESFLCIECTISAPFTNMWRQRGNALEQRFWGQISIERAAAFMWFIDGSQWRELIHSFKYRDHWYYAENIGYWLATEFSRSDFFEGIELIVPVPLHWRRKLSRGYNQTEHIAAGISRHTSIPYSFSAVKRRVNNPPQVHTSYVNRWGNSSDIFEVIKPKELRGRHILLVDDVCTTGSTLISLAKTITKACDGDVKISVATVAASRHIAKI